MLSTHPKLSGRLGVRIEAQAPANRKYDLDNVPKAVLDSITYSGLWGDDSQIDELTVIRLPPIKGGRLHVKIRTIE